MAVIQPLGPVWVELRAVSRGRPAASRPEPALRRRCLDPRRSVALQVMSNFWSLRISETHQLPGMLHRWSGHLGLVLAGFLVWVALPLHGLSLASTAAAAVSVFLASILLVSGRNARLVHRDPELLSVQPEPDEAVVA